MISITIASLRGNNKQPVTERALTTLFHAALQTLPDELVRDCQLIGVHRVSGPSSGTVRIEVGGRAISVDNFGFGANGLYYDDLPFAEALEEKDDFDYALQLERHRRARRDVLGRVWTIVGLVLVSLGLSLAYKPSLIAQYGLGALLLGVVFWVVLLGGFDLWDLLRRTDSRAYPAPSELERRAFERWRKSRLEENGRLEEGLNE